MNYFISYDIKNTQRRNQISKVLERFGIRIQKSVFQCDMPPVKMEEIKAALLGIFADKEDRLLFVPVCMTCCEKIISLGDGELLKSESFEII